MPTPTRPVNRLAKSTSPYLLQHRLNPVDWFPWGEEALEKARREGKPILLSIGYAACHWCHVMERDAFSVDEIASLLNQDFVSIKVDREERPDLDALYQGVVQLMGKGGGWPLTVFLTEEGAPFFGGTYFPPQDSFGLPSFQRVLRSVADAWKNRRAEVLESAASFEEGLSKLMQVGLGEGERAPDLRELETVGARIVQDVDETHGGFFGAPKFPHPMELSFLLRQASMPLGGKEDNRRDAEKVVRLSLDQMAAGGILDQLGGGFHRYSVDASWEVPHFEKMLSENALLLRLYAEAFRAFGDERYREVARGIASWLSREMTDPSGAFWTAQDADSEGVEGKFYVWTQAQVREVLGDELAPLASAYFGVAETGNFEGGATVLHRAASLRDLSEEMGLAEDEVAARLDRAREMLLESRKARVAPATDDKILTSWNGLAISALAAAGRVLEDPSFVDQGRRAAEAILERLWDGKELFRVHREGRTAQEGFLDDFAFLCEGLLELFESTGEERWLREATSLAEGIMEKFWDEEQRTFFLGPKGGERLLHRVASVTDNAIPSGGSSATVAFLRLFALTGEERWGRTADIYLSRQRDNLLRSPFAFGHLLSAALLHAKGITEVAVLGPEGAEREALLGASRKGFRPDVIAYVSERGVGPLLAGRGGIDGAPAAWICRHFACERPRTDPEEVERSLEA